MKRESMMSHNFKRAVLLVLLAICGVFLFSCSDSKEEEKSRLRAEQERIAREAVENIKAPIEKAEKVKQMSELRLKKMEEETSQ
jgi:hypothetical protein